MAPYNEEDDPEQYNNSSNSSNRPDSGVTGSAAALKYYRSFPAAEQERIRTSTGGNLNQWFTNAVEAGAVQANGERNKGEIAQADATKSGGWTPQQIREHFQGMGYDTFDLIDDNTINTWINQGLWDPQNKRFKPERENTEGKEIDYTRQPDFKPSDCPEGMTPIGHNGKCAPNEHFNPQTGGYMGAGGGGGAAGGAGRAGGAGGGVDDLQRRLMGLFSNQSGYFAEKPVAMGLQSGGMIWQDQNQPQAGGPQTGGVDPASGMPSAHAGGNVLPSTAGQHGGWNPAANGGSDTLARSVMTAFTPNAPSAQPQPTPAPAANAAAPTFNAAPPAATAVAPAFSQPGGAQNPLEQSVSRKYNNREWWQQPARTA